MTRDQAVPVSAEAIVRALAAIEEPTVMDRDYYVEQCGLCGGDSEGIREAPAVHKPDCPWKMAREWVRADELRKAPKQ